MYQLDAKIRNLVFLDNKNYYELMNFARIVQMELFMPGDIVLKEGDSGFKFYFITHGEMDVLC